MTEAFESRAKIKLRLSGTEWGQNGDRVGTEWPNDTTLVTALHDQPFLETPREEALL